jgi:uncharacterized phage-associated protein
MFEGSCKMTTIRETVFNNVHTVASYLYSLNKEISPLKLQKSLYFLFAYYGALYSNQSEEGIFEGSVNTPKYLFDANFEAWKYGPVIREVYGRNKGNEYNNEANIAMAIEEVNSNNEVKKFIDELFEQINSVSDFGLVDRSHEDEVWKEAYSKGTSINKDDLIEEYTRRYV